MITDYRKQMDLIKPHEFKHPIHIIGAGALGSWIAFILLKMGFKKIHIYDFDTIEEHNIPNQLYTESQQGMFKVDALEEIYHSFFNESFKPDEKRLFIHNEKITPEKDFRFSGYVFSGVDSMKVRKDIWENFIKYQAGINLWIEGRISIYGGYVYSVNPLRQENIDKYEKTLYDDTETEVSACGISQTALPSAITTASIMVMQMIEHFNEKDINLATEFSIPYLDVMKY